MLRRALEGATFITAYDRSGISRTVGATLPRKLDEAATRELAVKQAIGFVLSGAIDKQGDGYAVTMKATQAVEGTVVGDVRARASDKEHVISAAADLVGSIRKALGDRESDSNPLFAKTSLSANSLLVVRYYADAMDSITKLDFEEARGHLLKAVDLDPSFGVGYQVLSVVSRNLGQMQDAKKYIDMAMSHLDTMTDREQLTTRGFLYRVTGDNQQCVKEYGALIERYKADVIGHNQRALCASQLRDWKTAIDEIKVSVGILPKRAAFRVNLALYSSYSSDFETGEAEARNVLELTGKPDAYGSLALAYAQIATGRLPEATSTYQALAPIGGRGASVATSGIGDLAIVEGRYADAIKILAYGAAADLAAKTPNPDRAAAKVAAQGYAELMRGQKVAAVAAADKALSLSSGVNIRFLAGRIFVEAGRVDKAKPLIASLSAELLPEPQAYGKILEGLVAMRGADPRSAIALISEANKLLDTWIGAFDLGRAYLATNQFAQADSEFDRANRRRGESLALFLDEEPTYGYFPPLHYYWGRAREGQNRASAKDSYQAYVDLRGKAGEDVLLADARRRLTGLKK
jgi:tetratricopeptide (TPR) repeat protein